MTVLRLLAAALLLAAPAARAEVPRVAADILPVHGLVSRVMAGLGTPDLVLPPGASPHGYAMRPSEARALASADLVIRVGPELTPWLDGPLAALADEAQVVDLLDAEGTRLLAFREAASFAPQADGDGQEDDDHGHHGAQDPHAWLDPDNARAWLDAIAGALAAADPENAARYRENAGQGSAEIAALAARVETQLAPQRDRPFAIFHDATQYFETRFGLTATGALTLNDGAAPGPATMAALRDRIASEGIRCLFAEPGTNAGLVAAVLDGTGARAVELDPLGRGIEPGPDFYLALLARLADAVASCG